MLLFLMPIFACGIAMMYYRDQDLVNLRKARNTSSSSVQGELNYLRNLNGAGHEAKVIALEPLRTISTQEATGTN